MICKRCKNHKKLVAKLLCNACYYAVWREANREKVRSHQAKYYAANREKVRTINAAWGTANQEKMRAYYTAWAERNPVKCLAKYNSRKAHKIQATPLWADKNLIQDAYMEAEYQQMHVDHIVPLRSKRVCGLHWEGNLQLLTASENLSKGNRRWPGM